MIDFKFLDDKSDIEGMRYHSQIICFNNVSEVAPVINLRFDYYTPHPPDYDLFISGEMMDEFRDVDLYDTDNFNRLMGLMNHHFYRVRCDGKDYDLSGYIEVEE